MVTITEIITSFLDNKQYENYTPFEIKMLWTTLMNIVDKLKKLAHHINDMDDYNATDCTTILERINTFISKVDWDVDKYIEDIEEETESTEDDLM